MEYNIVRQRVHLRCLNYVGNWDSDWQQYYISSASSFILNGVPISWQHRQHRRAAVDRQHPCDSTAVLSSIDSALAYSYSYNYMSSFVIENETTMKIIIFAKQKQNK